MSEKPSPLLPDGEQSRDRLRAALALACALAVVLAGVVVPAVSGAGLGQTPLGSAVSPPSVDPYAAPGDSGLDGTGGLGALNPGERTGVGGSLASDASAFRSQSAETHLTVRSSVPAYWRTGAYDAYTGSGWKQSGDRRPYTGPIEGDGIRGREVEYRVTLRQSATALPSVWRANSLSGLDTDSLYVTDERAFVTGDPVPRGTTYAGVSHRPPRDPTVLRTAGRDYPADLERRYTALPDGTGVASDDTDGRLAEFTDDLTADADSPYETAERIESWLESNKEYSLNVSEPPSENVASQFVFEMERGYCEYFATAMTVMLRTQGVPARYVVGYSTGQSVGENTYRVRAMNAHAWVEVYFPEVGWVRFDPTPGSARLQAEQRAFANRTDAAASAYSPTETGSPGERFSTNGSVDDATGGERRATTTDGRGTATGPDATTTPPDSGTATLPGSGTTTSTDSGASTIAGDGTGEGTGDGTTDGTGDDGDGTTGETTDSGDSSDPSDARSDGEYTVELDRTPVPGATVEVTVREGGSVAPGVPVFFNGEQVGVTGESGTVTAEVPYAERLRITVGSESGGGPGATAAPRADAAFSGGASAESVSAASIPPALDAPMALASEPPRALSPENGTGGTDNESRADGTDTEYALATDATLTVSGEVATESDVVVTAAVRGVPVRNAEVTLGGESVGTTDENGRVRVRLPDSPGNVTLAVSRGAVSGERTVSIPALELAVDPQLPLALPGTAVDIRATYGGDPLTDAAVRVAGANLTTGIDGAATASLPFRGSAEVVVSARGQTRRTTVSGLYANLAGVLGAVALLVGGLAVAASRRGVGPRSVLARLLAGLRAVPRLAVAALFGAADRLSWAVETVLDALGDLRSGRTTVGELLARLRSWLAGRLRTLAERLREVRQSASPRWSLAALAGGDPRSDATADGAASDGRDADAYRTLREAWTTFVRAVSVRRPAAATPGELADHAVREDDLPPGPVVTLRDAFRDVEYGARSPDDRLQQVEEAADAIERATRPESAEGADGANPADGANSDDGSSESANSDDPTSEGDD